MRGRTATLCATLEVEDYVVQTMPDVSPTRWHLAHTTWFFETFVLQRYVPGWSFPGSPHIRGFDIDSEHIGMDVIRDRNTLFRDVEMLPAGSWLEIPARGRQPATPHRYWDFSFHEEPHAAV